MKTNNPMPYDPKLAAEGLVFREPGHRTRYLGTVTARKQKWLSDNEGNWRRVTEDDLGQFAKQPSVEAPVQAALAQSSAQTSSLKTDVEHAEVTDSCATAEKAPSPPEQSDLLSPPVILKTRRQPGTRFGSARRDM